MMGNRGGALHGPDRTLGPRRWVSRQWICCRLAFNGRQRQVMAPNRYTELFFLDEATALAAGHRPCFECRREDAERFAALWSRARGLSDRARAADIDRVLHAERLDEAEVKRRHACDIDTLPDGCFILDRADGAMLLVRATTCLPWSAAGYLGTRPRPRGVRVEALTPPSIIAAMKLGYLPNMHGTAREVV